MNDAKHEIPSPASRQAWANGSILHRQKIDDLTIYETNREDLSITYVLQRAKRGSSKLQLISAIETAKQQLVPLRVDNKPKHKNR